MLSVYLSGKNILVTGANRGIGKGIAQTLGKAGARVVLHYLQEAEMAADLARQIGNGSFPIQADLSSSETCGDLMQNTLGKY